MKLLLTTLATLQGFRIATACTLNLKPVGAFWRAADVEVWYQNADGTVGMQTLDGSEYRDGVMWSKCYHLVALVDKVDFIVKCDAGCIGKYCKYLEQELKNYPSKTTGKKQFKEHYETLKRMIRTRLQPGDIVKVQSKLYTVISVEKHAKESTEYVWPRQVKYLLEECIIETVIGEYRGQIKRQEKLIWQPSKDSKVTLAAEVEKLLEERRAEFKDLKRDFKDDSEFGPRKVSFGPNWINIAEHKFPEEEKQYAQVITTLKKLAKKLAVARLAEAEENP